jgi:hypothetical protein
MGCGFQDGCCGPPAQSPKTLPAIAIVHHTMGRLAPIKNRGVCVLVTFLPSLTPYKKAVVRPYAHPPEIDRL